MEKKMNEPKLRFPGFEGEWKKGKLDEFAEFKAGFAFKSEMMLTIKSNYQILKMSNVYQNELRLDRNPSYWEITDDKQKEFLLKKGDTILTLTGTVGKRDYGYSVMINEDNKFLLNQRLVLLRKIERKSNSGFINYLLSTEKFLFYFFLEAKGGTGNQTNVSTEDVKNICLNFPILQEQTKIASFLTSVDDKLTQLKKKKSLLEEYKKGVMQKIFSQELRFKDDNDNDFPEWEEKTLGEVACIRSGLSKDQNGNIEGYKVTRIETISDGTINQEKVGYIDFVDQIEDYKLAKGDILFSNINSVSHIGKTAIAYSDLDLYHGMNLLCLKCFNSINPFYLFYFLNLEKSRVFFRSICNQAVNQASINQTVLAKTRVLVPSLTEQTKIANFLSAIDEKINHCSKQIEKIEEWKKGLLQQMFC